MQGNVAAAIAAKTAGATHFFGYPITPSTEIFEKWVELAGDPAKPNTSPVTKEPLQYLQCEDEMASGFAIIGACMAGKKAFTATAGPGNILMQDAFAMAEAQRIPTVAIIQQRGGLSTSTVIYSQEEVTLTCFGGNGEGFRIVYSPSSIQELYDYTIKAFDSAWKYRFPTFVLGDGYQGKMEAEVSLRPLNKRKYVPPEPILLSPQREQGKATNLRNCFDQEEEINEIIENYRKEYDELSPEIAESELYLARDAQTLIIAHGIVAASCKVAIDQLRRKGHKIGMFRPITLRPLGGEALLKAITNKREIIFIESALGQLTRLVLDEIGLRLFGHSDRSNQNVRNFFGKNTITRTMFRPAIGITPEVIINFVLTK